MSRSETEISVIDFEPAVDPAPRDPAEDALFVARRPLPLGRRTSSRPASGPTSRWPRSRCRDRHGAATAAADPGTHVLLAGAARRPAFHLQAAGRQTHAERLLATSGRRVRRHEDRHSRQHLGQDPVHLRAAPRPAMAGATGRPTTSCWSRSRRTPASPAGARPLFTGCTDAVRAHCSR